MIVTLRGLGTKKEINAWFLKNRGTTYLNSFGRSFDSHFIRGRWSVLNIAQEVRVMPGSIWKCMKWHLGTEAMHDQQIGAYKDERAQAIRSKTTNWPIRSTAHFRRATGRCQNHDLRLGRVWRLQLQWCKRETRNMVHTRRRIPKEKQRRKTQPRRSK